MKATHVPNKIRREESDAKIITAAVKGFGEFGYSHCSISQIAKDAGVSPGLITNRYSSKENLFEAAFVSSLKDIHIDFYKVVNAKSFLIASVDSVVELYNNNIDAFNFMAMIYKSADKPDNFKIRAREEFKNTRAYEILRQEQEEGKLKQGDIINLFDVFLSHVYIQIDICNRFNVEIPSNEFFLSTIYVEIQEEDEFYKQQFMNLLLKEYQSAWLIKLEDLSLKVYTYNDILAVPNSVQTALGIKNYNDARIWYIENCVVEQYRKQLLEQTSIDYILTKISGNDSFFIEYGRIMNGVSNFNQLCYNKVVNREGDIEYVAMGFRNIDMAKRAEYDDVTGLLTRHIFFEKAEEILKNNPNSKFDIIISDIVDFKKINETYGAKVADDILRWQGKYLQQFMSENLLVGRYGGDQMVMFGFHDEIADCIDDSHSTLFYLGEAKNDLPTTNIKIGVYVDISHDSSVLASCDRAHTALNSIKHQYGEDIAFYNDNIENHIKKQRQIEESMRKSLRDGDFKVYYQPKHNSKTGELVGAEALIRWIHPKYGFMSPADFIPLFEQNGFIVQSDQYVWDRTCANLRRWMDKGIKTVPISVNASKLTITRKDLIKSMKKAIEFNELLPSQLHVEITETLMTENTEELVEILNKIRDLGCKVELDDFGSGYSSLNILSTLPIDILKLDMSFLQQFGDEKRSIVLESCIDMAQKLGFKTVSEGVELIEQKELLGELGVDMIQGYYYSKPLPEDEFEKYMTEH